MQQIDFAGGPYAQCVFFMVPVAVAPMPGYGVPHAQSPQAMYLPCQNGFSYQQALSRVAMPQYGPVYPYGGPSRKESAQSPPTCVEPPAGKHMQNDLPPTKIVDRKLLNKKIAASPAVLASKLAKEFEKRFGRMVLRGWRFAKMIGERDKTLIHKAWEGWRNSHVNIALEAKMDEIKLEAIAVAKSEEQLLRLALFGWYRADAQLSSIKMQLQETSSLSEVATALTRPTCSTRSMSETSITLTERIDSVQSEAASYAGSTSLDGDHPNFGFLGRIAPWELPRVCRNFGQQKRIGVDLGGVIFRKNATRWVWKALDGIRGLVRIFGANNVFIVSKVQLHGQLHRACCRALTEPGGFLEESGIPLDNVVFVPALDGPAGKGIVGARLGLTHFVDDKAEVLISIYADEAGNSGDLVKKFNGKLFHFEHGGRGIRTPSEPVEMPVGFKDHYHAVSGWLELLECFGKDCQCDSAQSSSVSTKKVIPIGIEGDVASEVIARLLRGFLEIENLAGVKIILRGKGSPHPQPKSAEQSPMSIIVRKANGGGTLDVAELLVQDLLREVLSSPH